MEEEFILSQPTEAFKKLSWPLIIFAIFTAFYNLIDLYWANTFNKEATIVIALIIPLFLLINTIGKNIGQGTNVVMSHYQGASDIDESSNSLIHGILICIIISIIIPLLVLIFFNPLISILNIQSESNLIYSYLMPLATFSFIFIFPLFFTETAISEGSATRPIIYLIVQDAMKLILAPILIFKVDLGIAGLAYTTLISSLIPFVLFMYMYSSKTKIKIDFSKFKLNLKIIYEIFIIAIPNSLDTGLFSIFGIIMNILLIGLIGPASIVIYIIYDNLREIITSSSRGCARSLLTIIGHLKGNEDFENIKSVMKYVFKFTYKLNIIVILIYIILYSIIVYLFKFNASTVFLNSISFGVGTLNILLIINSMLLPICYLCSHILNGLKKSIYSLLNTVIKLSLMFLFSFILSYYTDLRLWGVFIGILLAEIIAIISYSITTQRILFKLGISDYDILKIRK